MIREVTMHEAACDKCGRSASTHVSKEYIIGFIKDKCGWKELDGKLYCPDCYEYDKETDSYIPKVKEE